MCGRFTLTLNAGDFLNFYGITAHELKPRYNIAPSQSCPVIVMINGQKQVVNMNWGLNSPFKGGYKIINVRAETINQKPTFKKLYQSKRCLVPADGFFEWKKSSTSKIPYRITLKNSQPFTFAGIYSQTVDVNGQILFTFALLTTAANSLVENLHDRIPVILKKEDETKWLDEFNPPKPDEFKQMVLPYSSNEMELNEVSSIVNSWKNNCPQCVEKIDV